MMVYEKFYLRSVTMDDAQILLDWRNDFETRKNSFHTEEIRFTEHQQWLNGVLKANNEKLYILEEQGKAKGQIRLSLKNDVWNISYSIAPAWRGQGYGKIILQMMEVNLAANNKGAKLKAEVKKSNIASQKLFLQLGYSEQENSVCYVYTKNATMPTGDIQSPIRGGVLLLSNNRNSYDLYEWLEKRCSVQLFSGHLNKDMLKEMCPRLVISYNYRYIIPKEVIDVADGRFINMHTSLLPWNKGASPNIWSFVDNTPKGVTIHKLIAGLDAGDIIYQKELFFDEEKETLATSYAKLNYEIVQLFKENWADLYNGTYQLKPQISKGSNHTVHDFEKRFCTQNIDYNLTVAEWKQKLKISR